MAGIRKRQGSGFALAAAVIVFIGAGAPVAFAQATPPETTPDMPPAMPFDPPVLGEPGQDAAPEAPGAAAGARLGTLLAELAEPGRADWQRVEDEIERIWSRSGSAAMDLLLRRAGTEMQEEDYAAAADHLTALTELAPDFAEGWNARATVYYNMGEYALAMADLEHVLALNPDHFGALTGVGLILEQSGAPGPALDALRAAERLNPNRPDIGESIDRVERSLGTQDL